jgi:hypothetical protein
MAVEGEERAMPVGIGVGASMKEFDPVAIGSQAGGKADRASHKSPT